MGPLSALILGLTAGALVAACGDEGDESAEAASEAHPIAARVVDYERHEDAVGTDGLVIVDPSTGRSTPVLAPSFSGGDAQFAFVPAADQIAYRCSSGACVTGLGADTRETRLGDAWCIAPSVDANHLWLAVLDPDSPATERAIMSVSEIGFDGSVRIPSSILPSRRWHCPVGSFEGGVLFQGQTGIAAWDARSSEVIAEIPDTFPAGSHGTLIATYPDQKVGPLRVTDLATDHVTRIPPPAGWSFEPSYEGAFSPDASRVAVTATPVNAAEREGGIAIVDLSTGAVETTSSKPVAGIAWATDGTELYTSTLADEGGFRTSISVYDPDLNLGREMEIGFGVLALDTPPS